MNRMFEIKNLKYECVYSPIIVKRIKELMEIDYPVDDCLDFVDLYGEKDFLDYYDLFVDFQHEYRKINVNTLIEYYSGFSFLDLEFYGEYKTERDFIEQYYEINLAPVIIIDWDQTINQVKKLFDFIPSTSKTFYIFGN